ncbi:ABC transporter substrate-binding protein, partial [Chloroflexota bacterium]
PAPSPAPSPTPAPGPAPSPAPAPKSGGVVTISRISEPSKFGDPVTVSGRDGAYARVSLQELLVADGEGGWNPNLAESWTLAPDKSAYIFKLRKGVKFHDGTDFNAQAVKWNLDRQIAFQLEYSARIKELESVDVIDDYTVRLNLSSWNGLILPALQTFSLMYSPTTFDANGQEWAEANPVGTGAFKLKKHTRGISVDYERFDDYWGGAPYLDGVRQIFISDEVTALAAALAEEVHVGTSVTPENAATLDEDPRFTIYPYYGLETSITMNTKDPALPFYDKRVRYALEYALDKETMNQVFGLGYTKISYSILTQAPGHPSVPDRKYDPAKAKALLAEAGYPNGFATHMIRHQGYPQDVCVAIQGFYGDVGIDMPIAVNTRAAFQAWRWVGHPTALIWQPMGGGINALYGAVYYWGENALGSDGLIARPPGLVDLVEQAKMTVDPDRVAELLVEADTIAYGEAMMIPLWSRRNINHANTGLVQDARINYDNSSRMDFSKAWLKE